jgi:ligand-binding SRPBCC domain-containing protein
MRRLVVTTVVAAPAEVVFDLSLDLDLHRASMARSQERAIGGVRSGSIGLGESVTWRARHLGIWWTMTSRIDELDRPKRFVDAQVDGPFGSFRHEHRYTPVDDGTTMTDLVDIAAPFGWMGRPFEPLIAAYLRRLLTVRSAAIAARAEASSDPR